MTADSWIQGLTIVTLAGLLMTVGLRLTLRQVVSALRGNRFVWLLSANFIAVPALTVAIARLLGLPVGVGVGMMLLAAAPFAPVVPVFTRMGHGDLALAAAFTVVFPTLSALLTPLVCSIGLRAFPVSGEMEFDFLAILMTLLATMPLPLAVGIAVVHWWPGVGRRLLQPVEVLSEAAGATALAWVTLREWPTILATGWPILLIMAVLGELSLVMGFSLGGPGHAARRVTALATSNRNIALALLLALHNFAATPVVPAVVANGLVLILLGLIHVGMWRLKDYWEASFA